MELRGAECVQLESKCRAEMDEHRQKIDREFDTLVTGNTRELDAISQRHVKERERHQKVTVSAEARRRRHVQQQQETEMKQFLAQQKKDYGKWKDELRKVNTCPADELKYSTICQLITDKKTVTVTILFKVYQLLLSGTRCLTAFVSMNR